MKFLVDDSVLARNCMTRFLLSAVRLVLIFVLKSFAVSTVAFRPCSVQVC